MQKAFFIAIVVLVVGLGIAGVRALQTAPTPADEPTPRPTPGSLGSLAYAVDGDFYVAKWDGSNAVRIADGRPPSDCQEVGEYSAHGPIWSPDGRYLAYRHMDCDAPRFEWDVVISDKEGNVVTSFPSDGWGISWSPDSTRVAVWVRWDVEGTIGVYGLDDVRQTLLTVPPGMGSSGETDPVWSPDGESLLLLPNGLEIPLDGSTPRRLPWGPQSSWTSFSPDGSRVAYTTRSSLVIAAADGSDAQEVFGDSVWPWSLVWSPAGDRIAFTPTSRGSTQLRVLDVATGTATLLTEVDASNGLSVIDFSPQGDRILFLSSPLDGAGSTSLWSVNADGSDLRRVVARAAWGDWLSPSQTG